MPNQANIERFESLLTSVNRPGIDKLLDFIRKSDFYTAPASTRFHGDREGGLLEHTLNVYDCLVGKKNSGVWAEKLKEYSDESLILVALLHDLCKTYMYGSELKNKKVFAPYSPFNTESFVYDHDKMLSAHNDPSKEMAYDFFPLNAEMISLNMGPLQRGTYSTSLITDEKWQGLITDYCSSNNLFSHNDYFSIDHEIVAPDQFLYDNSMILMSEMLEKNYREFAYENYLEVPDTEAMREVRSAYADILGDGNFTYAQDKLAVLMNIRNVSSAKCN